VKPVDGVNYCSTHDDVWHDDESECQAVYFDRADDDESDCVRESLWWGDLRARDEAIIAAIIAAVVEHVTGLDYDWPDWRLHDSTFYARIIAAAERETPLQRASREVTEQQEQQ